MVHVLIIEENIFSAQKTSANRKRAALVRIQKQFVAAVEAISKIVHFKRRYAIIQTITLFFFNNNITAMLIFDFLEFWKVFFIKAQEDRLKRITTLVEKKYAEALSLCKRVEESVGELVS